MRRFEFTAGTSRKFWEIEVAGSAITLCFGRLGTQGQSKTKHFADAAAAAQEAESLIGEKVRKGYGEVARDARPAPAVVKVTLGDHRGVSLIIRLQGTMVILGEGSERSVQHLGSYAEAKEHFERVIMLRKKSGSTVLSAQECGAETIAPPDILDTQDFEGEIKHDNGRWQLTFRGDPEAKISTAITRALVRRLAAASPRLVHILCDFASPKQAWARAIGEAELPSIESFVFDTHFQTQTRQYANSLGDLAAVLRACPNLENFFATGKLTMSPVTHRKLRTLHLLATPLTTALAQGLGGCTLPALDRLVLSLACEVGPADQEAVLTALRVLCAPRLRELHLIEVDNVPDFLHRLVTQGLPPELKILSLCGECELQEIQPILARHADKLRALTTLGLTLEDESDLAVAQKQWPFVGEGSQWRKLILPEVYQSW